ncbi:DUF1971 domain-containing protein [Kordiimonas aquimaris]|uniref:DUF1971 domain-containing protein n=1 Tax=Kordiimonas aquimaris TaxID=707591 RepID=UPI0021D1C9E6|nr:DUF1971 domain-containing protein [Kordiimonas aquimaris]
MNTFVKTLPEGVQPYNKTPLFSELTVPKGLLKDHNTKSGVWGVINVVSGNLRYTVPSLEKHIDLSAGDTAIVVPEQLHHVTPLGAVSFYVEFWR